MFYFDEINSKKILKSTLIKNAEVFFTTKESFIKTKDESLFNAVRKNKKDICSCLKIKEEDFISPEQTHGTRVCSADKTRTFPDTDALIITNPKRAVYLNYADCTPVILYDIKNNKGAIIHAGWRGSAAKICVETLRIMESNPDDIFALIGPCICFECFETGSEVINALEKTVKNKNGLFREKNGRMYADLKNINARQLKEQGVKNIDICPYCTCCNNDLFFSYRLENKTTNRISAVLKINP